MTNNSKNATYHFIGATIGLVPLLGIGFTALYYAFRKFPSIDEENHYRAVINFQITLFAAGLGLYLILPEPVADMGIMILFGLAMIMMIYNGYLALKGKDALFPFSFNIIKLARPTRSPEEIIHSQKNNDL
jgi:hypothetical protein